MNLVQFFLPILAFLLVWQSPVQAEEVDPGPAQPVNCTQEALGANSPDEASLKYMNCESKATGAFSPQAAYNMAQFWCQSQGDFCKIPACRDRLKSSCQDESVPPAATASIPPDEPPSVVRDRKCVPPQKLVEGNCVAPPPEQNTNDELKACEAARDQSRDACTPAGNMPMINGSGQAAISTMCQYFKSKSLASAGEYAAFGNRCMAAVSACRAKCNAAKSSVAEGPIITTASTAVSQCDQNVSKVQQSGQQGIAAMSDTERAEKCDQAAKAKPPEKPSDPTAGNPTPQSTSPTASTSPNSTNPNQNNNNNNGGGGGMPSIPSMGSPSSSPSAQSLATNGYSNPYQAPQQPVATDTPKGQGGFQNAESQSKSDDFNVANNTQMNSAYSGNGDNKGPNIPGGAAGGGRGGGGGGGGGLPGSDGQGARFLPPRAGGAPAANSSVADVLQGFQGGGYSAPAASGSGFDADSGSRGYGGGLNQATRGPASQGMDLRNYLPGGSMDPGRRAGGFRAASMVDINSAHVNIWNKVGDRLRERCRLGQLFDCR